jgi:predicted amino acid-binding ACT domain protein
MSSMNSYDLSRGFINFAFDNPEKISPNHYAIYFFAIEHCNRLGWKSKFGLPTMMVCDAVGIKKPQTFIKYFNDLEDWGFIDVVERSKNQYSANIISLISATTKKGEAMDKAMVKHAAKQGASKGQSNSPIDKQVNKEQLTIKQENISEFDSIFNEYLSMRKKIKKPATNKAIELVKSKLNSFSTNEDLQIKVLEQSILNCWQNVYPLKDEDKVKGINADNAQQQKVHVQEF